MGRIAWKLWTTCGVACVVCAACEVLVDTGSLTGGLPADAGTDASLGVDSGVNNTDAAIDAGCPGDAGPAMIRVGSYCVDATEVTLAQYTAFLAANVALSQQPQICAWNTSFVPQCNWPSTDATKLDPVACVDWCDARAFCAWSGKRLCGAIGGGASSLDIYNDAGADQWFQACSRGGTRAYPYGNTQDSNACNGAERGVGGVLPVGSSTKCEGGYTGLFDMNGNVYEWEDLCNGATGSGDTCSLRGGGYEDNAASGYLSCGMLGGISRSSEYSDTGIRCCAP